MRVMGMISGTSHDGIDIAVVDIADDGEVRLATIEYVTTTPYSPGLRDGLIAALPPAPVGFDVVCELDTAIGQEFGAAAAAAIRAHAAAGGGDVDLVCSHGQTVYHWVQGGIARGTLQLGEPAWIAQATGRPVVSHVRAADVAAGGQGAPLVPILDRILLEPYVVRGQRAAALNLGGISNMTVCAPGADAVAWDIGPANALIDAVVTAAEDVPGTFDRDGAIAASGTVDDGLLALLLDEPYYALPAPKSSGKELFHHGYVDAAVARFGAPVSFTDLIATLTELTARTVADAVATARVTTLVASGGGVRNPTLMARLAALLPDVAVLTSDALGIPSDAKEAVAFALIGWATAHGLPANVASCTGAAGDRVLGRLTPAPDGALPSVSPLSSWPRLRFRPARVPA